MDNEYMIRGGAFIYIDNLGHIPLVYDSSMSLLWAIRNVSPPESDDDFGEVPHGRDTAFIISATTVDHAIQLHKSNVGMEHQDYDGSRWTIEHIGVDQRLDKTNKFILAM